MVRCDLTDHFVSPEEGLPPACFPRLALASSNKLLTWFAPPFPRIIPISPYAIPAACSLSTLSAGLFPRRR
jgi:hypothetical protein